jgi:hypothetical protein
MNERKHNLPTMFNRLDDQITGDVLDAIIIDPRSRGILYLPGEYSTDNRPPGHQVKLVSTDQDNKSVYTALEEQRNGEWRHLKFLQDYIRLDPARDMRQEGTRSGPDNLETQPFPLSQPSRPDLDPQTLPAGFVRRREVIRPHLGSRRDASVARPLLTSISRPKQAMPVLPEYGC